MNLVELIFSPNGRINRLQFLGGYLTVLILVTLLYIIPTLIFVFMYSSSETFYGITNAGDFIINIESMHTNLLADSWLAMLFFLPATLIMVYGKICLDIKRFRDTGFSPWFILLFLVPWVNILVLLFLLLFPGREE